MQEKVELTLFTNPFLTLLEMLHVLFFIRTRIQRLIYNKLILLHAFLLTQVIHNVSWYSSLFSISKVALK